MSLWCVDGGGRPYLVEFETVTGATGPPRFEVRVDDGSVHRLLPVEARARHGLGRLGLNEFQAHHPVRPSRLTRWSPVVALD